ncbi:hypothetical protein HOLleu_40735 [Holothuria leucospilota]|uniref:DDE Tnp4 domain-containing protein n=1 Tax=Holothuria leucospilota TaxID=206669 RepID=A0A9Q1BDU2_HOLLE|nr:hypothetical protein HOLleu_40735 [Holothuria leucospilota]
MEVFLRCIGDPGFQVGVGKDIGIHQSTVSRTFADVLDKVVAKADTWIQFPSDPTDFQAAKDAWQKTSYNKCHKKERLIIERCFGQLKRRFPMLQGRVRIQLRKVPSLIVACCIMHNVAKCLQDPNDFPEYNELYVDNNDAVHEDDRIRQRGQERRRQIANIIHENHV